MPTPSGIGERHDDPAHYLKEHVFDGKTGSFVQILCPVRAAGCGEGLVAANP